MPSLSVDERLGKERFHDFSMHVRESEVAPRVAVGEAFVVQSEAVEEGSLKVMNVNFVFDNMEAHFVCRAIGLAAFDAAACQPHREGLRVVVTS